MFYSQFILAKKGPLGTIWIAAHLERKLRKNQVADTDIGHSVDSILFPDMPIALRLSSHLLLGVVRIYSRKVNYLFDDCSEALLKVKQAFRSTAVDLPPEESTAPYHSITLPETFDLDDFELPDNDLLEGNFMDHHVSTREQITLQDTMDGTAYSTSQFGLDERFGDGDASQIGLDLEEELISEKAVGPVQYMDLDSGPQASTEPTALSKDGEDIRDIIDASEHLLDRDKNKIEDLASNAEYMDYAHTPYTPGLVEEPMGENIARDNHLGEEDQVFKESLDIENVENVCGKLDFDQVEKDAASMSHQNDTNQDTVDSKSLDENGHFSHEVENPDNLELSSNTFALNGDDSVKDFPDRVINNEKIMCSSVSTAPKEIEPSLDDSRQQGSSCDSKHDQGSGQPEGPPDAEVSANPEFACIPGRLLVAADDTCAVESLNKPECASDDLSSQGLNIVTSSNNVDQGGTPSVSMQLLRPCNSHPREGGALSDGMATLEDGQDSRVTDIMKPARKETHLTEPNLIEVQPHNNSAGQVVNAISHDNQSGNLNTSGPSALPAPEKLLSVPDVLADKPNDLLLSSIPNKEGLEGDDSTQITGKKRSFTESTLTVQSLTSEESFRDSRSKRTVESMPDDDDVLSSILVGRRSLGLNLKSTPSAPELPSSKRIKSSQRPSTIKRKVLMDDAMVLHGDTIRQQLVSTEDIRRIRKKAPCTRPEILLIQRQFFEDGMLNETIFSGMSVELNCLYCEAYDLSKIRICENAENNSSSEFQKTAESSVRPTAPEEIDNEGRNEVPSLENNVEVQSKDLDMVSNNVNATMAVVTEAENMHDQMLDSAVGMEVERVTVAVNAEDHSAGLDSSFTPYLASGEHKPEEHVGLNLTGAECVSTDRKFNTQVNEHASAADTASEKVFDAINGAVDNASTHVEGGSEYEPCKCIELDDIDGSSIDVRVNDQKDLSSLGVMNNSNTIAPPETGSCDKQVSINGDRIVDLSEKGLDNANKDNHFMEFPCKDKSPTSSLMHEQEPNASSHVKNKECQVTDEADVHDGMDAESTAIYQPVGEFHDDLENIRVENDTGFLNEDDAEVADEGDALPTSEDLENSGWSARTRAVAKYLQNAFDKEALHGRKVLSVDNLLSGKTRKEASRMFFETLVLKTRDYIHVEQAKPLDNIVLKPRVKLMKSEF